MEITIAYWGNIKIVEKKFETTLVYWVNVKIMEEHGNKYSILGVI